MKQLSPDQQDQINKQMYQKFQSGNNGHFKNVTSLNKQMNNLFNSDKFQ